jgi:hypothetical protein
VFRWPPACSVGFIGDAGQARRPPVVCSTADPLVYYLDVYPRAVGQLLRFPNYLILFVPGAHFHLTPRDSP